MRSNNSTKGQCNLTELFKSIADLLPPTPPEVWEAWVREGQKQKHNVLINSRIIL